MLNTNPILIIEDDPDDQIILKSVFADLAVSNQLLFFSITNQALAYLQTSTDQPFLIFCSTSLPLGDGIGFKKFVEHHQSRLKSIPFIFISTQVHSQFVQRAYSEISLQGIFIKQGNMGDYKRMIQTIYDYWQYSLHPNQEG